jgi:3-oxoacyl-[acyl-carrier-protein] synthase II
VEVTVLNRRVVVTGIGLICGSGNTKEEVWSSLLAGRSSIGPITKFDASQFPVRIASEVKNFDPLKFFEKKEVKKMDVFIHYAVAAAQEAMDDSGLRVTVDNA